MSTIDTKPISFGHVFEILPHTQIDDCTDGHVFLVDGETVGLADFGIKNEKLTIIRFDFNVTNFGDNRRRGFGTIFLKLLTEHAKNHYQCEIVRAVELTKEGEDFFLGKGFKWEDKNKEILFKKI